MSPLDLPDIARLEEFRQAGGLSEVADEFRPIGGGVAGRGARGSWLNNAVAAGLNGPVDPAELDGVIGWYIATGVEPRFEVCPFADAGFTAQLEERGFGLRGFETVLFRALDPSRRIEPVHPTPSDVAIDIVDPANDADVASYARVAISGFMPPGVEPEAEHLDISARTLRHPRSKGFAAHVGGRIVGAGAMEISGEVAGLFGLSVLPEFRRRGIQQALIAARLNHAAQRGARIATVGSKPGIATERNVRRMGFEVAYTKAILTKTGPNLAAVPT